MKPEPHQDFIMVKGLKRPHHILMVCKDSVLIVTDEFADGYIVIDEDDQDSLKLVRVPFDSITSCLTNTQAQAIWDMIDADDELIGKAN